MNDRQTFEPASTATSYLQAAGAAMVLQITNVVASGIWLNQGGWMFNYKWWQADGGVRVRDYLAHVPRNNTLIIELAAERGLTVDTLPTKNYWGHTWVWSLLHNYGQRPGMYGNLWEIVVKPAQALLAPNSTCTGFGISPEGIEQNPVVYELMFELVWRNPTQLASGDFNLTNWLQLYVCF